MQIKLSKEAILNSLIPLALVLAVILLFIYLGFSRKG
jgi:hypothetical protein